MVFCRLTQAFVLQRKLWSVENRVMQRRRSNVNRPGGALRKNRRQQQSVDTPEILIYLQSKTLAMQTRLTRASISCDSNSTSSLPRAMWQSSTGTPYSPTHRCEDPITQNEALLPPWKNILRLHHPSRLRLHHPSRLRLHHPSRHCLQACEYRLQACQYRDARWCASSHK